MRVLVCGSREFDNWSLMHSQIFAMWSDMEKEFTPLTIIEGGAIGADFLARVAAKFFNVPFEEYKADWKKLGWQAGHIRNQQMLDEGKPDVVLAFWDGKSTGTADMIRRAEEAGFTKDNGKLRVISF